MSPLRFYRLAANRTAKQCAEALGVSEGNYWKMEAGNVGLSLRSASTLADYLGVTLDQLAGRQPLPLPSPDGGEEVVA